MTDKPLVVLGEAWGENEARIEKGFVGPSGVELLNQLHESKLIDLTAEDRDFINKYWNLGKPEFLDCVWEMHPEIVRMNVFNLHPPGNKLKELAGDRHNCIVGYPTLKVDNKAMYVHSQYQPELDRLADELVELDPNLILCLGNTPLWALTGKTGISKLRGTTIASTHTVADLKLIATYHPAAVLRQWELRPVAVIDLQKAKRESFFPEIRRPKREIWIEPGISDIERFISGHVRGCRILAVDIETAGNQITNIGFAANSYIAINIPFFDNRTKTRSYWPNANLEFEAWTLIRGVLADASIRKVFQNGLYDIAFLLRAYGIIVKGADEDTMLLHHALQPESLKGLAFLGSVYTDEGAWKQDRKGDTTIKADA